MLVWLTENIVFWHWIVLGCVLMAVEMLVPSFFWLWFGVSALIVGVLTWLFPLSLAMQLSIWGVLSVLIIYIWFKVIAPYFKTKSLSGMAKESMLHQVGTVIEFNPGLERGKLRFSAPVLGNDEWLFICSDALRVGDKVVVLDFAGNALIVTLKPKA